MILEEALAAMRAGKKIRHSFLEPDEYYQACYVGFHNESFEEKKERGASIVFMKGDKQHPDMRPTWEEVKNQCKHGTLPQINLLLLMSDDWDIAE